MAVKASSGALFFSIGTSLDIADLDLISRTHNDGQGYVKYDYGMIRHRIDDDALNEGWGI